MDWSTEMTANVLCIYALRESKGMNFRKDGVSRLFFLTDGAELLLDLGCSPSLVGKCWNIN